ncbi:MAG: hypothetical protein FVQ83_04000 [Chloroflexi bacterium]|nr:hypothetical protein [Chloroflexota bacterium]
MRWRKRIRLTIRLIFLTMFIQVLGPSSLPPGDELTRVRAFTRSIEFDFADWTLDALIVKLNQISLPVADYLDEAAQHRVVLDFLDLVREIRTTEFELELIYADPNEENVEAAAAPLSQQLDALYAQRDELGPLAETVLQSQLKVILTEMGFTLGGQPLPPILYRSTPLPWALIVSPREIIRQDANISLRTEQTLEQNIALEDEISQALDVSTLVVPVGGVGSYPTMVAQTTNLNWLSTVIAHEWIHNFLTLRPLGMSYNESNELRIINETAASLAGDEIGHQLIASFYPEFLPPPPAPQVDNSESEPPPPEPLAFDFRAEMHETRITTDALLADGEIEAAEAYMEARRSFFWEHGYRIRKLNQAYFAFYGAYADAPIGAAGEDPVGAAVRAFRLQSDTLEDFIKRLSWLTSFEQLEALLEEAP